MLKLALRMIILLGMISFASCSDGFEEIQVQDELTKERDPGDGDQTDCKTDDCGWG